MVKVLTGFMGVRMLTVTAWAETTGFPSDRFKKLDGVSFSVKRTKLQIR